MTDYITVLLTIITIVNSGLGLLILFGRGRTKQSKIYSVITLTTLFWIFSIIFYRQSSPEYILLWAKTLYISATLIASCFLFFTYLFPVKDEFPTYKSFLIFFSNAILIALVAYGDLIIVSAHVSSTGENTIQFGKLYFVYVIYILSFFNYSFYRLFTKYKTLADLDQKRQALFFLTGYFISTFIAFATNLILPWLKYFELNWAGQVSTVFIVTFATYAIVKHRLFNIKAIAAELFIGALWIFLIIRIVLGSNTQEKLLSGGLLVVSIFIGMLLIKSINSEVKAREEIELLAKDLTDANERLKELDGQKTEFVSLASHQLRGPLTAIKGYGSMLLEGDFGELTPPVKDAIEKIYKSTQDLVVIVGDYLDVSRIEQGRMQFDFSTFDIKELVETVAKELKPNVENAHLTLAFDITPNPTGKPFLVNADKGKIKQVLSNIIDNSIKYTPQGGLHIWLAAQKTGKVLVTISDTGVGIHPEVLPKLFAKFTRAPDASKTNILGTGLGLYVARKIMEAHNGRIWAESAGTGKGSSFFMELELVEANTRTTTPATPITPTITEPSIPTEHPPVAPLQA